MTLAEATFCYQAKLRSKIDERITKTQDRIFLAALLGAEDLSSLENEREELIERYNQLSFRHTAPAEEPNQDDKIRAFLSRAGIKHSQERKDA